MFISIDNIDINYSEFNSSADKIILLVHGWGARIESLKPIINLLKHDYRVIAVDLPGHGHSSEPKRVFGTEDFSDIIVKFINALALKDINYIGHSFGGKCGIFISSSDKYKSIIKKLVLIDASGIKEDLSDKAKRKVKRFKMLKKIYTFFFGEKNLEKFYKRFGSEDYKNANGIMRNCLVKIVNEDLTDNLSQIEAPTLLLWGEKDSDTPLWMGEMMKDIIKDSRLVVLDGGHYSYLDDIIGVRDNLPKFLED